MPLSQIVSASIEDGAVAPVDLSSVAQYTGFKNRIINGAMGIWQRGTTSSVINAFVADRWAIYGATSITGSRSTDVPAGFQYSLSLSGTNFIQTYQRIESVNCVDLPGQSITVSFWAKQTSGAGAASLATNLLAPNAADNYASSTQIGTTTFTGSTSWTQYTTTFTNITSNVANGLQIIVYSNSAGAATFLVTGIQVEKGTTATSFDYRPYGTELALCQRYYLIDTYTVSASSNKRFLLGGMYATIQWEGTYYFPVEMRSAPTLTTSAVSTFWVNAVTATSPTSITAYAPTTRSSLIYTANPAFGAAGYATSLSSNSTNGTVAFIAWSAEL